MIPSLPTSIPDPLRTNTGSFDAPDRCDDWFDRDGPLGRRYAERRDESVFYEPARFHAVPDVACLMGAPAPFARHEASLLLF